MMQHFQLVVCIKNQLTMLQEMPNDSFSPTSLAYINEKLLSMELGNSNRVC